MFDESSHFVEKVAEHTLFYQFQMPLQDVSNILAHPVKIDLNKKWLPKQKTIQNFSIDALGFRKTRNENPPTWEIGVSN